MRTHARPRAHAFTVDEPADGGGAGTVRARTLSRHQPRFFSSLAEDSTRLDSIRLDSTQLACSGVRIQRAAALCAAGRAVAAGRYEEERRPSSALRSRRQIRLRLTHLAAVPRAVLCWPQLQQRLTVHVLCVCVCVLRCCLSFPSWFCFPSPPPAVWLATSAIWRASDRWRRRRDRRSQRNGE